MKTSERKNSVYVRCGLMSEMKPGETARVAGINISGAMRRRLQDLGLVEGTRIECVLCGSRGGPKAFLIRGAVIAVRCCDSRRVTISRTI